MTVLNIHSTWLPISHMESMRAQHCVNLPKVETNREHTQPVCLGTSIPPGPSRHIIMQALQVLEIFSICHVSCVCDAQSRYIFYNVLQSIQSTWCHFLKHEARCSAHSSVFSVCMSFGVFFLGLKAHDGSWCVCRYGCH